MRRLRRDFLRQPERKALPHVQDGTQSSLAESISRFSTGEWLVLRLRADSRGRAYTLPTVFRQNRGGREKKVQKKKPAVEAGK